jgi:hypothetical protein
MAIAYVNAGSAVSLYGGAQSVSPALPASLVSGNILLCAIYKTNTETITPQAGWLSLGVVTVATYASELFYKISDGTETSATFSWTSNSYAVSQIFQYSGANAIGTPNSAGINGSPIVCAGITSTAPNSLAVYIYTSGYHQITAPSGWASDSSGQYSAGSIGAGSKVLASSGSLSGDISTATDGYTNFMWVIELKYATAPIDAPAESTSSASSTSAGGLGIASAAESSGAAATESTYIFAIGAFATSSGAISGSLSLIFEMAGSAISSGILGQETLVVFMANADAVSTGVDASSATVTRFTFELINTGITITGEVKASRIYYDIGSSSGNITSAVQVLRTMDASVIANALLATGAIGSASYHLIAESLAQMISGIVYVNDYVDGWAYNLNNQAPSFYENFKFNSFAKIGNDYYGLNASGLHIINANDDNGTPIEAVITTGISDFEDERTKKIQLIYANARTESALELTVRVDNEPEYSYDFISSSAGIAPTRVKLGKGLQGRNWQIEIKNKNGADFEISDLDIPILPNSRRV